MADEAAAQNLPHLETEHFEVLTTNNGRDQGEYKMDTVTTYECSYGSYDPPINDRKSMGEWG